jgi:hypothetical protein
VCPHCQFPYRRKEYLNSHLLTHHGRQHTPPPALGLPPLPRDTPAIPDTPPTPSSTTAAATTPIAINDIGEPSTPFYSERSPSIVTISPTTPVVAGLGSLSRFPIFADVQDPLANVPLGALADVQDPLADAPLPAKLSVQDNVSLSLINSLLLPLSWSSSTISDFRAY